MQRGTSPGFTKVKHQLSEHTQFHRCFKQKYAEIHVYAVSQLTEKSQYPTKLLKFMRKSCNCLLNLRNFIFIRFNMK